MNVDIKVRRGNATIFKAKQLPFEVGVDSLNTLARKYGLEENYRQHFEREIKDMERELSKQTRFRRPPHNE